MSVAPALPLVPVEEYLSTSYEHDMEYVDGVLVERGMPTVAHCLLQKLLLFWLARYEKEMSFVAIQELRTQITPNARYRIPDLMLCPRPLPKGKICDVVPWAVIEVLSPDDTLHRTRERFRDYAHIGVTELVLMDPEDYVAYRFDNGSLIETGFESLMLPGGARVPFDSATLFAQLRAEFEQE